MEQTVFQGRLLNTMSIRWTEGLAPSARKWGLRSLGDLSLHRALNLAQNKAVWAWWYPASWRSLGDTDGQSVFPAFPWYINLTFNCCNCFCCRSWCWTINLSISNLVRELWEVDLYLVELLRFPEFIPGIGLTWAVLCCCLIANLEMSWIAQQYNCCKKNYSDFSVSWFAEGHI